MGELSNKSVWLGDDERLELYHSLSENINDLCKKNNLTIKELSAITGIARTSLDYYLGNRENYVDVGLWNIYRLSVAFGVSIDELLTPRGTDNNHTVKPVRGMYGGRPSRYFL